MLSSVPAKSGQPSFKNNVLNLAGKAGPYAALLTCYFIYVRYWAKVVRHCSSFCGRGYDDVLHYQDFLGLIEGTWPGSQIFIQSPLPAIYLGILHAIFRFPIDNMAIPYLIQASLTTLTCAMIYVIACRLFSKPVGLVTVLLLGFYEFVKFYNTTIEHAILLVFLLTATLYFLIQYQQRQLKLFLILAAICLGISLIGRQNNAALIGAAAIWLILLKTPPKKLALDLALLVLLIFVTISPFIARNSLLKDQFTPFVIDHGVSQFTMGNLPGAPGTYWDRSTQSLGPAIEFIRTQPGAWLLLTLRKVRLFFTFPWMPARLHEIPVSWIVLWLATTAVWFYYFFKTFSRRRSLLHFSLLCYAASIIITHVEDEYRLPILPVIFLFAAVAITDLTRRFFRMGQAIWKSAEARQAQKATLAMAWSLLVLLAFALSIPPAGTSEKVDAVESDRVYGGVLVGQRFEAPCPNLNQVSVKMSALDGNGHITFHLAESAAQEEPIYSQELDTARLTSFGYHTINFPKIPDSAGKQYAFYFDTAQLDSPEKGLIFAGGRHPLAESLNRIEFEKRFVGGAFVSLGSLDGNLAYAADCKASLPERIQAAINSLAKKTPQPALARPALFILLVLHVAALVGGGLVVTDKLYRPKER